MALQAIHEKLEEIPEQYQDLYTEKDGKFELTGIVGVKTQADVDRVKAGIAKERELREETENQLKAWKGLGEDLEEIQAKLDKYPELEAASKGKLDEAQIDEIATKRAEGIVKSQTAPLERQLKSLNKENEELKTANQGFQRDTQRRTIRDAVGAELIKQKVRPEAHEDAYLLADAHFEIREDDGKPVTKENVGVTPGAGAADWLLELQDKRSHWWPESTGGGARGGAGGGGGAGKNPWSADDWNVTDQGRVLTQEGREKAEKMAKAAGSYLGATKPPKKKAA